MATVLASSSAGTGAGPKSGVADGVGVGAIRLARAAVLLAVGAAAAGCASHPITLRPGPRTFTESDYESVYDAWTRDADDFSFGRLRTVIHATATFESWEFRWAYVVRYAHDQALGTDARTAMLRASLDDARERHRFFVTIAGENYRESDLSSNHSAWRVLLVDEEGRQTVPVEVEKVRRPGAAERTYFPSVSPFRFTFRISFPSRREDGSQTIPESARYIILRFTGPLGTVDLKWKFLSASP